MRPRVATIGFKLEFAALSIISTAHDQAYRANGLSQYVYDIHLGANHQQTLESEVS